MVSSPHNPTGRDFAPGDLRAPTARGAIVLMDRAYREFAKAPDANEQVGPGIFRFYSFSKAWALASFRLGVLVGPRRHIEKMRARQIYLGVDATSLRVLEAALAAGWAPEYAGRVARLRRALCSDLERREFPVVDTETNFVLVRERRAAVVRDHLESCRVRVATTDAQGLPGHLRISVGRSRDHAAVLRALESARGIMRR
jgi:histidinol-phosphate/aromatic aminotransferase/cobyric acid decarboxylase-like protein